MSPTRFALLLALLLAMLAGGSAAPSAESEQEKACRHAVERYFAAVRDRNDEAANGCLVDAKQFPFEKVNRDALEAMSARLTRATLVKWETTKAKVLGAGPAGPRVRTLLVFAYQPPPGETKPLTSEIYLTATLKQIGTEWRILRLQPAEAELAELLFAQPDLDGVIKCVLKDDPVYLEVFLQWLLFQPVQEAMVQGDFTTARGCLRMGVYLAGTLPDKKRGQCHLGLCLIRAAQIEERLGNNPEADKLYDQALVALRQSGDEGGIIQGLANACVVKAHIGDFPEAKKLALEAQQRLGKWQADLPALRQYYEAQVLSHAGLVWLLSGELTQARKLLYQADDLAENGVLAEMMLPLRVAILGNLSKLTGEAGELESAENYGHKALTLARKANLKFEEANLLINLAATCLAQGRNAQAFRHVEDGLKLAEAVQAQRLIAQAWFNFGVAHEKVEANVDAARSFVRALEIYEKIGEPIGTARAWCALQRLRLNFGADAEAHKAFRIGLTSIEKMGSKKDLLVLLPDLAELLFREGHEIEARQAWLRAAALASELGDHYSEALQYLRLAILAEEDPNQPVDEQYLAKAQAIANKSRHPKLQSMLHGLQGERSLRRREWADAEGHLRSALEWSRQAEDLVGDPLLEVGQPRLTTMFQRKLVVALLGQDRREAAWQVVESSKAGVLNKLLERSTVRVDRHMSPREIAEEARRREAINILARQINSVRLWSRLSEPERKAMFDQYLDARQQYEQFQRDLTSRHAGLETWRGTAPPPGLAELAATYFRDLPDGAILSFLVSTKEVLTFVVTQAPGQTPQVAIHTTPMARNELAEAVGTFCRSCRRPGPVAPDATDLYDWLIAPIEKELQGKTHLLILPDDCLRQLPFAALREQDGPYLVERFSLSLAPSLGAWLAMRQRTDSLRKNSPGQRKPVLVVGRPRFSEELKDLPFSEAEAQTVCQSLGQAQPPLLGDAAKRSVIMKDIQNYRGLHFATHGLINGEKPMFSALALTPEGNTDRLFAHEIMKLDLNAEWVVLSACESALGRNYAGEGILGLTWAFFVAGVPCQVATLWSVADGSTATLMREFYGQLADSKVPHRAEALRYAQLVLLKQAKTQHPYYWAPFVLLGDFRK